MAATLLLLDRVSVLLRPGDGNGGGGGGGPASQQQLAQLLCQLRGHRLLQAEV